MRKSSALAAALLVSVAHAGDLDQLLKKDRERISAKEPLDSTRFDSVTDLPVLPVVPVKTFTLVVIPIEFSDATLASKDGFSEDLADYAKGASFGALEVSVRRLEPVKLSEERGVLQRLKLGSSKEGELVLRIFELAGLKRESGNFDGVCLLYAGAMDRSRESVLWPHKGNLVVDRTNVFYFIAPQGAASVHAHEFMHLLGLDDKTEGATKHCILSFGYEKLPLCGACAAKMGWVKVHTLDVGKDRTLKLADIRSCGRVLRLGLNADGKEALILETRAGALLVWHVDDDRTRFVAEIDGASTDRLTPLSVPSFKPVRVGSRDVFLTDVRFDTGTAYFRVSRREALTEVERYQLSHIGRVLRPR